MYNNNIRDSCLFFIQAQTLTNSELLLALGSSYFSV